VVAIPPQTTATDLGDSVIVEDNGNVAIGSTPSGIIKLKVFLKPPDRDAHETIEAILTESFYDDPVNNALDGQTTGSAVAGFATNTVGITSGVTGVSYSKHGTGVTGAAVSDTGKTIGVKGASKSPDGIGVQGAADSTTGETIGVRGESKSDSGAGVYGIASETTGVNYGVKGESASPNGYAGYFVGNVNVTGNLTKGGGAFKIDHPLDPENKTLSHSFVESPDMMNIYNGIVRLGKDGSAEVTLPDWFEALNREFRYQLTCIGGFAPVYVAKKVDGNRFKIAGGKPGMEVSWQLTGVRKDAYAETHRIQVEEMKPVAERGSYLHPEAFGKSAEKGAQQAYEKAQQR
jgi:trimeric autotransporter adhesin